MKELVALGAAVLVAGIVTTWLWTELRAEGEAGRALDARVALLEERQASAAASHTEQGVAPPEGAAPVAGVPAAATPASPQRTREELDRAAQSRVTDILRDMTSPQSRDATHMMMRGMLGQMYPDLAQELGLSADEATRMLDLLARHQSELTAESVPMLSGELAPAAIKALNRKMLEKEEAQRAEVEALLGSRYPQWEDYQATAAARQEVDELRTALSTTADPLTEAQSKQLITVFSAHQRRALQDERTWVRSPEALEADNPIQQGMQRAVAQRRALLDVAAPHLTARQREQHRQQIEQQAAMLQGVMGMMGGGK